MLHTCIHRCYRLRLFMPGRIIVPGYKVNHIGKLVVVQSGKVIHHIDGRRLFCPSVPQRFDFPFYKIRGLIPDTVQPFQCAVFFLHPAAECLLAQRAVALSAVFIRNMPCNHARVIFEHFRQLRIDDSRFFPVNR